MKTTFNEVQKFNQKWLIFSLIGVGIIAAIGVFLQLILGIDFGNNAMSDTELIIFTLTIFAVIALFWIMKLKTEIDQAQIRMTYFPFTKKKVSWAEVKHAEVLNYGFIGGWGIRIWTKYGTVYNTRGNKGLAIQLKNGKKFLIGTQKEAELKTVINHIKSAHRMQ